jgi:histone-binding protein RBBP4
MATPLASLEYHKDAVTDVKWAPFNGTFIASASEDRRVCLWDISKLAEEESSVGSSSGEDLTPATLLFLHGGHTAPVCDLSWNKNDFMVLASVAEDNIVQAWQMNFALLAPDMVVLNEHMEVEPTN